MGPAVPHRGAHRCLARRCGHPDSDHVPTPELASRGEVIVWCVACLRHEGRTFRPGAFRHRPTPRVESAWGGRAV